MIVKVACAPKGKASNSVAAWLSNYRPPQEKSDHTDLAPDDVRLAA